MKRLSLISAITFVLVGASIAAPDNVLSVRASLRSAKGVVRERTAAPLFYRKLSTELGA